MLCLYIYALINNDDVRAIKLEQGRGSMFDSLSDGIPRPKIAQLPEVLGTEECEILSTENKNLKNGVYISEDLPRLPYYDREGKT